MARRGFLGRVRQALRAVFPIIPKEPRRRAPKPPPEPPPEPPRRRRAPTSDLDDFQRAWMEETLRRPSTRDYRAQRQFFNGLYRITEESHEDQVRLWREFVKFNQRGAVRRNDPRHPFWHAAGIHPDNFDWHGWRQAMNYPEGRRKR